VNGSDYLLIEDEVAAGRARRGLVEDRVEMELLFRIIDSRALAQAREDTARELLTHHVAREIPGEE
jgi:hypothetical protein